MAINLIDLLANKMISKSIQLLDLTSIESIEMDSRLVRSNTLFVAEFFGGGKIRKIDLMIVIFDKV
jgi:hypothetical protein